MMHENMAGNEKKTRKWVCKMWDKHMGNPPPPTAVRMGGVMRKDAQGPSDHIPAALFLVPGLCFPHPETRSKSIAALPGTFFFFFLCCTLMGF